MLINSRHECHVLRKEIVLIGPMGAGKSTLGQLLSSRLEIPQCSMDDHRWRYYNEIGYDEDTALYREKIDGFLGLYSYWKRFEIHAVERILLDHEDCVFDFGAGHSVYRTADYLARAEQALSTFPNTFLLLPTHDEEESLNILVSRNNIADKDMIELNRHFISHPSNKILAKHIIYTEKSNAEYILDSIVSLSSIGNTM